MLIQAILIQNRYHNLISSLSNAIKVSFDSVSHKSFTCTEQQLTSAGHNTTLQHMSGELQVRDMNNDTFNSLLDDYGQHSTSMCQTKT